jgi:putative ABC transport system permease protein
MLSDLRQAARALRKNPGYTTTALITLSLAIGANSAIFSIANALIFASMPVAEPARLLEVSTLDAKAGQGRLSIPAMEAVARQTGVFSSVLAWNGGGMSNLEMNGSLFAGSVDEVAGDYYETLGLRPALGRFLKGGEPAPVAVIGYRTWQESFHGDPAALGKTIRVNGKPYTVIGVHPKAFPSLVREAAADATVSVASSTFERVYSRKDAYYVVIGRLRDGVSEAQARARIAALWPAIRESTAPESGPARAASLALRIQVEPAARGQSYLREQFTKPLYILLGIVGLLLMLACVNLASVALARAYGRAAEMHIRTALGATRWRLVRASLLESLLLAICGILPGLAFAYWGGGYIARFMWRGYGPLALSLTPDWRVIAFTAGAAICAGLLFGLIPSWSTANVQTGARVTGSLGITGKALVSAQIALSFAILAGALILSRGMLNLLQRDTGFRADRLLVAQLFPRSTYKGFDNPAYFRQLLASLESMPGVTAATFAHDRPVGMAWKQKIMPAGVTATHHLIAPGFFHTLGMRLVRGRDFDLRDDTSRPLVAIASAALARTLAASGDAIGQRVKIGNMPGEYQIVGIASDATLDDPRTPNAPAIYAASFQRQDWLGWSDAIIRTPGDPARMAGAFRARIESLGREYPLRIETVGEELDHILIPERVLTLLTSFFGALGLLLAAVGLYGLLSYTVSRRTAEIGVRVALGAPRAAIARLMLRDVAALLAIGLAAGLALAWIGSRAIAAFLYGVSGHDPAVLTGAALVLILVALCASLLPSLRAVRVDPVEALRHE